MGHRKQISKALDSDGYRRLLRWAALPIADRRWAAPLSAVALGFGLFVGVAIGPGAAGTFATGAAQIIEIPDFTGGADTGDDGEEGGGPSAVASSAGAPGGEGASFPEAESALPPLAPVEAGAEVPSSTEPSPPAKESPPPDDEPEPEEQTLTGVVLHVNSAAGSYTLAEPGGTLDVIHAGKSPQPGTRLSVPTRLLANGTFAEVGTRRRSGKGSRATFSGIVTYVDPTPTAPAYTVSKRGISVLVHVHPDPTGAAPVVPALGAYAKVTVEIERPQPPVAGSDAQMPVEPAATLVEPPSPTLTTETPPATAPPQPACAPDPTLPIPAPIQPSAVLWQRQISAQGAPFTYSDFAGMVAAICPATGQLLISADDIRESQHDLLFTVPPPIDTSKLEVGQSVLATATIGADGSLTLAGLASDDRRRGADDATAAQGDLVSTKPK